MSWWRFAAARVHRPLWRIVQQAGGRQGLRILIFHDVPQAEVAALDATIGFLKAHGGIVAPEEAEEFLEGKKPVRSGAVLLTFDDGYRSNAKAASEVLDRHGVRAVFFVCPGLVDRPVNLGERFFPELPAPAAQSLTLMNWDDLRRLKTDGHTIGSHSLLHRRLTNLSEAEVALDLEQSFVRLSQELGAPPAWFAFPFGDMRSVSPAVILVASRFFRYICSGIRGINTRTTNRLALLRESIELSSPPHYIRLIAEGGLDLLYRSRARKLDQMASEVSSVL